MPRPLFESSLGTVVIYSAGCHFFLQLSADAPQAFNRIYPALVPRSFLTADGPHLLNSPDWHSLRGPFVKPSVKNWTFVENPSVKFVAWSWHLRSMPKAPFEKRKSNSILNLLFEEEISCCPTIRNRREDGPGDC
jgi:hypothetical protein